MDQDLSTIIKNDHLRVRPDEIGRVANASPFGIGKADVPAAFVLVLFSCKRRGGEEVAIGRANNEAAGQALTTPLEVLFVICRGRTEKGKAVEALVVKLASAELIVMLLRQIV